jgi:putative chitinase
MITVETFIKLFSSAKSPLQWVTALNKFLPKYEINSLKRVSTFLAQTGHESCGFTAFVENLNYSAQALANTWPKRYALDPNAKTKAPNDVAMFLHRKPEAIANNVYANRMGNGNEASGDGWRNRGKGLIQITGKENHEAFAKYVGMPIEAVAGYMLTIEGAVESACWFWFKAKCNSYADADNFEGQTKVINGGLNGYNDRKERLLLAKAALS